MKKLFFIIVLLVSYQNSNSQNPVVCPYFEEFIRIENSNYIPTIENNIDGTVNLEFDDPELTSIFAEYIIGDFHQLNPDGSESMKKIYRINCNSRELLNDIDENIEVSIINANPYVQPDMPQEIIEQLDNQTLEYKKYCTDNQAVFEEWCDFNINPIPDSFNLILNTHYDVERDMIIMQSQGLTPCGNNLELGFKAGTTSWNPSLFLWYINSSVVNNDVQVPFNYLNAEKFLMNMLGVGCENTMHYGDLLVVEPMGIDDSFVDFARDTDFAVNDRVSFQYSTLNVTKGTPITASIIKLNNVQAKITGLDSSDFILKVYDLSGKKMTIARDKDSNIIDISKLSKGLYFFQISYMNNNLAPLKFLK